MFILQINPGESIGAQDTGAAVDGANNAQTETVQPNEVEVLRSQLVEKDRELQSREQALYEQNVRLQTYQELFEQNKSQGMSDVQASHKATADISQAETIGAEYLTTQNVKDTLSQMLDEREQKQTETQKQQYVETFVNNKVSEGAIQLLNSKYDFNGTFTQEEKKAIFQDRLPKMIELVKNRYPTMEGAFKRAFLGLVKEKGFNGVNTQTSTTSGLADTSTQVAGSPGGGAADFIKTQELERAKVALEKKEIPFREYLAKFRAVHGDKHAQATNSF
jgi:hypothetical protein